MYTYSIELLRAISEISVSAKRDGLVAFSGDCEEFELTASMEENENAHSHRGGNWEALKRARSRKGGLGSA
jgi:hypothetical protein